MAGDRACGNSLHDVQSNRVDCRRGGREVAMTVESPGEDVFFLTDNDTRCVLAGDWFDPY